MTPAAARLRRILLLAAAGAFALVAAIVGLTVLFGDNVTSISDPAGDCAGCDRWQELTALEVEAMTVTVRSAGPFVDGAELFLFSDRPGRPPTVLTFNDGSWAGNDGFTVAGDADSVTIDLDSLMGVAVVSPGGDRAPDTGYAAAGSEQAVSGHFDEEVAVIQAAYPSLGPIHREYVLAFVRRQFATGTFSYEAVVADLVEGDVVTFDTVSEPPLVAQHFARGGQLVISRYATADGQVACNVVTGECADGPLVLAIDEAAAAADRPGEVDIQVVPARIILDEAAECFLVGESFFEGPAPGEWCMHPDGALAYSDTGGDIVTLVSKSDTVDPDRLIPPEG